MGAPKNPYLLIGAVLRGTFARLFASYGWLVLLSAFVALTDVPGYLVSKLFPPPGDSATAQLAWAVYELLYSFAVFLPFSAFALAFAALLFERRRQGSGARPGLKETIGSARAVLLPVMGAKLPLFAAAAAISFIAGFSPHAAADFATPLTAVLVSGAIPVLYMVLDVCLMLLFCVAPLSASLEGTGWRAALRRSLALTKGHRLAIFGMILLVSFLPDAIVAVLRSLPYFFPEDFGAVPTVIAAVAEKALLLPLYWAFTYALFVELKRLEGDADPGPGA